MIESCDGQGLVSKARSRGGVKLIALVPCDDHFQALGYKRHHSKIGLWNSRNTFFANHSVHGKSARKLQIIFRSERQSSLDSAQESEKVKKQFGGVLSILSILNPTGDIEASHDQPWIFWGSQVGPKSVHSLASHSMNRSCMTYLKLRDLTHIVVAMAICAANYSLECREREEAYCGWSMMTQRISHASSSKEEILVLADLQRYDTTICITLQVLQYLICWSTRLVLALSEVKRQKASAQRTLLKPSWKWCRMILDVRNYHYLFICESLKLQLATSLIWSLEIDHFRVWRSETLRWLETPRPHFTTWSSWVHRK